jgi:hypothetical protein
VVHGFSDDRSAADVPAVEDSPRSGGDRKTEAWRFLQVHGKCEVAALVWGGLIG